LPRRAAAPFGGNLVAGISVLEVGELGKCDNSHVQGFR
jgi:hypothetical protein